MKSVVFKGWVHCFSM